MRSGIVSVCAIAVVVLFSAALVGCGSDSNTPEDVAVAFTEAVSSLEFGEAGQYATEESRNALEFLETIYSEMPEEELEQELESVPETPSVVSTEVTGDSAIVTLENGDGAQEVMNLVRVDGEWLVNFEK